MEVQNYNVIGVMSGTSLDGIDMAHLALSRSASGWTFKILEHETVSYNDEWYKHLHGAVHLPNSALDDLNNNYTQMLGAHIRSFIERHDIQRLDAVCSHGHTIKHDPSAGVTIQIGNLPELAQYIGQKVVCDFRVQDVMLGGQGAPLVPIGDRILFGEFDYCVNLGGFSNISFESEGLRKAFDVSPVNTVLNHYSAKLGMKFDDKGIVARSGEVNQELLGELDSLPFYRMPFPKSLGIEFVHNTILPIIDRYAIPVPDVLRTFTMHAATQLGDALPRKSGTMLLTGGGAYNDFFIDCLTGKVPALSITVPEPTVLEFKEALVFGLLGVLRLESQNNVLASVTGARHDHCSGDIFLPGQGR